MIILSNGFPTNMPNSEKVSHGGPANFARLFTHYTLSQTPHYWIGVMMKGVPSQTTKLKKIFHFPQREYHRLFIPMEQIQGIVRAKSKIDPDKIFQKSIDRLAKFMKEKEVDVVFLNGFGVFNWILLKAAKKENIPTFIQHAGILNKELSIHKYLYTTSGRKIMEQMEKDSTKFTSAEIFLNEWSKNYYQKKVAKKRNGQTNIIPLPFDFDSFKKMSLPSPNTYSRFNLDKDKLHIGFIARWDEIKNHKIVLKIAKEIKRQKLNWQIHAVVRIPDTPKYKKIKEEYEQFISVIPALDRAGISDFCRSVDILIQPSIFDVSPTVVLEAISLNTPIVISPTVGYVNDFLNYGAQNWVLDFKDAKKTISQLKKLLGQTMPKSLKNRLAKTHEHKIVFETYLNLFEKISNQNNLRQNRFTLKETKLSTNHFRNSSIDSSILLRKIGR